MENKTIIVIYESVASSIIRDTYSVFASVGLIGIGVYLGSSAMEWVGFIMVGILALARMSGMRKDMSMTPDDAIAKINEIKENNT